jgi:galactonate dehydratase
MNRRQLLTLGSASAIAAVIPGAIAAEVQKARQLVDKLEMFELKVNARGNWTIIRLTTTGGITGIGDASQSGNTQENRRFLKNYFGLLRGRDVSDVEWLRGITAKDAREHGAAASVAASALEHCLWDIQGKLAGLPTYDLFGGRVRDSIRVYANINRSTSPRTPEGFASMASAAIASGFNAVKLAPFDEMPRSLTDETEIERFTSAGIRAAAAVRSAIGPKNDLLIDAHSHFDLAHGLRLADRLASMNLFWLEETTPAPPPDNLAAINRAAPMSTAGGESIYGVEGFYPYIKAAAVDVVMPDVKVCGGLLETKKIAAIAQGAGLLVSPHGPASPVGNVAAAQVAATIPNFNILELSYGEVPWRADVIHPPEAVQNSSLRLTREPGFGISLNEKIAQRYSAT